MRLLSVGYAMPNPNVDNHTIFNAPSLFDYDLVLVDPSAVSSAIDGVIDQTGEARTAAGLPITEGPSTAVSVNLAEALRVRRDETERLLARGGVVIVFGYPNVSHHHVPGFAGCDRYFWLPAPPGLSWAPPDLVMGAGRSVVVRDAAHPFAEYIDEFRKRVAYRAHFREGAAFGDGAKIFARSHGGAVVGVDIPLGAGRIVFIPPLPDLKPGTERSPVASCILDAGRKLLEMPPDEEAPEWTRSYALPGLEQKEAALAEAEEALVAAEARFEAAYRDEEDLARYRGLLWREGPWALDPIVHQAFRLLGFEVNGPPEGPAVLKADGVEIMLEVEGAPGPVDMAPHYRLRDRRERWLAERGALPRGLVVVNGERLAPPERRQHPYIDALRIASESMGYALLTATDLFGLVQHALADTGEAWRASVRRQIAEAAGPLRFDDPRAEAEIEPPVAGAAEAEPESAPELEPASLPDTAPARPRAH